MVQNLRVLVQYFRNYDEIYFKMERISITDRWNDDENSRLLNE